MEIMKQTPQPNEVFKNDISSVLLHTLIDQRFETSIRPKKSDVATIPPIQTKHGTIRELR